MQKIFTKKNLVEHSVFKKLYQHTPLADIIFKKLLSAKEEERVIYLDDFIEDLRDKGFKIRWCSDVINAIKKSWGNKKLPVEIIKKSDGQVISLASDISQGDMIRITKKINLSECSSDYINWEKELEKDYSKYSEIKEPVNFGEKDFLINIFSVSKLLEIKPKYSK